jgi:acyl-CoA dehydrogenase
MDFTLSPRIEEFRARIAAFVESEILPVEADRGTRASTRSGWRPATPR